MGITYSIQRIRIRAFCILTLLLIHLPAAAQSVSAGLKYEALSASTAEIVGHEEALDGGEREYHTLTITTRKDNGENDYATFDVNGIEREGNEFTHEFDEGLPVTVKVTPSKDYELLKMTVNGEDVTDQVEDNTYQLAQLAVNTRIEVTARQKPIGLTVSQAVGGSVTVMAESDIKSYQMRVVPDEGYQLSQLTEDKKNLLQNLDYRRDFDRFIEKKGTYTVSQSALREITLPASLTSLGSKAFQNSKVLERIVIKGDIGSLADHVFSNCTGLRRVELEHPLESLGENAFEGCTSLQDISLPEGLTAIGMACFGGCSSLQELTLPASLRTLGWSCFQYSGLTKTTIPEGVETLEPGIFSECASLTSVGLPRTLTRIRDYAFYHCASLKEVVIPENVIQVGSWGFSGCASLERVVCRSTNLNTEYIADNTFADSHYSRVRLTVPAGQKAAYTANERWNRFTSIAEGDLGPNYNFAKVHVARHGAVVYEGETLVGDTYGGDLKQYTILYEEGKDTYLTIQPEENYEPDIGVYNALPQWKEAEEYMQGNELHFGADSRPTEIIVHFRDLYSIITIRQGEGGCFQLREQRNHQYQYRANPLSGWQLHSITYDGTDMTPMLDERQMLQTPPLTHDVTLNIAFERIGTDIVASAHTSAIHVYGSNGTLHIEYAEQGEPISIYTVDGCLTGTWVAQTDSMQINLSRNKLYIVSTRQKQVKIWL